MRFALYTYINMYDGCSLITRRCHRANPSPITSRRCSIFLGFDGEIVRKWSDIVKSSSKEQNRDISDLCDEEIYISYLYDLVPLTDLNLAPFPAAQGGDTFLSRCSFSSFPLEYEFVEWKFIQNWYSQIEKGEILLPLVSKIVLIRQKILLDSSTWVGQ